MKTDKLIDYRERPGWIRARLTANTIALEGEPGGSVLKECVFETETGVRELIRYLESAKGNTYARPRIPLPLHSPLYGRMHTEGRDKGLSFVWDHHPGYRDPGYRIYARAEDVDRFIHDLMHLAWMLESNHQD